VRHEIEVVPVTDGRGRVASPQLLEEAEPIHRQLRPRQQAHKFYFREQMPITAFHFSKKLK
jgi:hypothetical protein